MRLEGQTAGRGLSTLYLDFHTVGSNTLGSASKMLLLLFTIITLHLLAFSPLLVSTSVSYWAMGSNTTFDLWTNCTNTRTGYHCHLPSFPASEEWFLAVQALMIVSVALSGISFFLFFCQLMTLPKGGRFFFTGSFQLLAGLIAMSAALIYTILFSERHKSDESFGYSYFLAWVGVVFALISGFLYFIVRKRD